MSDPHPQERLLAVHELEARALARRHSLGPLHSRHIESSMNRPGEGAVITYHFSNGRVVVDVATYSYTVELD